MPRLRLRCLIKMPLLSGCTMEKESTLKKIQKNIKLSLMVSIKHWSLRISRRKNKELWGLKLRIRWLQQNCKFKVLVKTLLHLLQCKQLRQQPGKLQVLQDEFLGVIRVRVFHQMVMVTVVVRGVLGDHGTILMDPGSGQMEPILLLMGPP